MHALQPYPYVRVSGYARSASRYDREATGRPRRHESNSSRDFRSHRRVVHKASTSLCHLRRPTRTLPATLVCSLRGPRAGTGQPQEPEPVSRQFAINGADKWHGLGWEPGSSRAPVLDGARS
ncbi:hypothetical protein FRAHR75_90092 [Frankia sp. Hr75.2]|nr:hypothetical protein FRAHR75_90092 [Frankia sp. Hr75.2]